MKLHIDQTKLNTICTNNKISYLGLFGSYARDEQTPGSDVDLLVDYSFETPVKSLFDHLEVQYQLENLFEKKVDLVTKKALHPYIRDYVLKDLKTLYEK